ncbi:MAG: SufD family Fe-S cluster assembly protein [Rikenellaceae bacterium]
MNDFLKYLESHDLKRIDGGSAVVDGFTHIIINNGANIALDVTSKDRAAEVLVVSDKECSAVTIRVAQGAKLKLVEVLFNGANSAVSVEQAKDSESSATIVEMGAASGDFKIDLNGEGATARVDILQLIGGEDRALIGARIAHNVAGCTSHSIAKCIAGGNSTGEFRGIVYVAKDAQRTEAHQNSRNIALSSVAKIIAEPQLEIYADDVKCSHGATVGQMNKDAILYMQQRGLSEDQARKLQLEGFVSDITSNCAIERIAEPLSIIAKERLERC